MDKPSTSSWRVRCFEFYNLCFECFIAFVVVLPFIYIYTITNKNILLNRQNSLGPHRNIFLSFYRRAKIFPGEGLGGPSRRSKYKIGKVSSQQYSNSKPSLWQHSIPDRKILRPSGFMYFPYPERNGLFISFHEKIYEYRYLFLLHLIINEQYPVIVSCAPVTELVISFQSSIRHALYQKWFKKIAISDEKIGSKGCFWTINRRSTPKEWRLPSSSPG